MSAPRVAYVVSHTHWDREWYLTLHQFRVKLIRVVREMLDALENDPDYRHFVLDGQTIVLEDYLKVHPEDEDRIRRLVESGALSIGPWYILPDEFLISAEAHVRNLLIGREVGERFGRVQRVGYMPDSFGHIAQMPQILQQAGIDSFIYTRGNGDEIDTLGYEYLWRAPDGREVLAVNQCGGYCNAAGLGHEEIWHAHTRREIDRDRAVTQIRELFEKMAPLSGGDIYLLNNGCDHFPPQRDFGAVMRALADAFPDTEFRHTSLEAYVDAVRSAGIAKTPFEGELLGGRLHHILSGVWSARLYLKQRNDEAQGLLATYLEPLAAYVHFATDAGDRRETEPLPYPQGFLTDAWKTLLANHPHDSICGCSIDEVHRDMLPRFDAVTQSAEQVLVQHLEYLAPTFARRAEDDQATVILVANPLSENRTEVVERLVVLQPGGPPVEELELVNGKGEPVPFTVVDTTYVERFWGIDYRAELLGERQRERFGVYRDQFSERMVRPESERDRRDTYLSIQLLAEDLPAVGHATYHLRPRPADRSSLPCPKTVVVTDESIENDRVRVQVYGDGSFDLEDRQTGRVFRGLNRFEDTGDVGDEYDYSPAGSGSVSSDGLRGDRRVVEDTGLRGALEVEYPLPLPRAIEPDRRTRSPRSVDCSLCTRIRLSHDSPVVEVETTFDNRAGDHRLQAVFPTGIRTPLIVSDGHFFLNHRRIERPPGTDWVQPPPDTYPQQDFSLVEDGAVGLAVFNQGLPEIGARTETDGSVSLSLTLLRSVGWLSRDDFESRRHSNAGPTIPTPDAQCVGRHVLRYAVMPFRGCHMDSQVPGWSRRYRTPPLTLQGVKDQHVPATSGLVRVGSTASIVTAIKRHQTRDTLVVRLYNLTGGAIEETFIFGRPVDGAWRADLLEERGAVLAMRDDATVRVPMGAYEIVTVEVAFRSVTPS